MYFKQILNEETGCSSYVIASRRTGEAVVVDPALDIDEYLSLARSRNFSIRQAIDTHLHADHVSGARKLAEACGAELCLHESADVLFPFRGLGDDEVLSCGDLLLRVLHTPGHRPEALSILITNPPRSPEPSMALTGDTLFVGDVGRPDFGGPEGAAQQFESVHRLLELPDYVEVFPAHFEGSCGKGMCGRPSSTIGFERRFNPMLQLPLAEFLERVGEAPARPLNMDAIIATNRGEADYEWAQPHVVDGVPTLAASEAKAWLEGHAAFVLDVREPSEFASGHIAGAVSIPQSELALRLAEVPRDRDALVVCAGGVRSLRAAHFLASLGYRRAVSLDGGTEGWIAAGNPVEGRQAAAASMGAAAGRPADSYFHGVS